MHDPPDRSYLEHYEERTARYLECADQALRSAALAKYPETRQAYLAIASSWLQMAEDAWKLHRR